MSLPQNDPNQRVEEPTTSEQRRYHPGNSYPGGFLIPETEIRSFVGDIRVRESRLIHHLLRAILNVMSEPEETGLMEWDVLMIRELATAYDGDGYRAFRDRVVGCLSDGPDAVVAGYKTVRCAMQLLSDYPADDASLSAMEEMQQAWMRVSQPSAESS